MRWYEGGIAEAVAASKKNGSVFVVYIEGGDENSRKITKLLESGEVCNKIENGNFVAIKIEENSVPHQQFTQIYKEATKPSIFFIGRNGVPIEILVDAVSENEFLVKVDEISQKNELLRPKATPVSNTASATHSQNLINSEIASEQRTVNKDGPHEAQEINDNKDKSPAKNREPQQNDIGSPSQSSSPQKLQGSVSPSSPVASSSTHSVSPAPESTAVFPMKELEQEEKLKKYQEIIEKKKEEKAMEEKEKEKEQEIKRRKIGQDVQKLKRWQEEQDLKQLVEQREKNKREEQEARQRVLAQIAQDKAERAARFANASNSISPPTTQSPTIPSPTKPTSNPNVARLQFKLPDGSSHTQEFSSTSTLQEVRDFIAANLNLSFRSYTLSTMFPKREFSEENYSQTLADLQLVPNAVVLILPISQGVVSTGGGGLFAMMWFFFGPIVNFLVWLKNRFVRGGRDGSSGALPRTNVAPQQDTRGGEGAGTSMQNKLGRKVGETTVIRRQGNVHRLVDKDDKDDENNTWNGNSTQQM